MNFYRIRVKDLRAESNLSLSPLTMLTYDGTVLTYGTVTPNLAECSKHPFDWEAGFPIKRSMIIEIYPLSMKIVLWIRGCFTIIQNQAYSTPTNIFGRHQSYTKMALTYGTQKLLGKNLRPRSSR